MQTELPEMKCTITEIFKCSGRLDLAKEIIYKLAGGLEKKKQEKTAQRPKERKYGIKVKRYEKEWPMTRRSSGRNRERQYLRDIG